MLAAGGSAGGVECYAAAMSGGCLQRSVVAFAAAGDPGVVRC